MAFRERVDSGAAAELAELADDTEYSLSLLLSTLPSPVTPDGAGNQASGELSLLQRMLNASGIGPEQVIQPVDGALRDVIKEGHREGSTAYRLARKLQPNKKFRPYERLNDAKNIRGALKTTRTITKFAPVALPAVQEGMAWRREQQKQKEERRWADGLRRKFEDAASEHVQTLKEAFESWLGAVFQDSDAQLAALQAPLVALEEQREDALRRLADLESELAGMLAGAAETDGSAAASSATGAAHD